METCLRMEQRWGAWVRWKGLGDLQGIRMEGGPGERTRSEGREGGPRWGFFFLQILVTPEVSEKEC